MLVLQSGGRGYVARPEVVAGVELIDKWKVFTSKSSAEHAGQVDRNGTRRAWRVWVVAWVRRDWQTYVLLGSYDTEDGAENSPLVRDD